MIFWFNMRRRGVGRLLAHVRSASGQEWGFNFAGHDCAIARAGYEGSVHMSHTRTMMKKDKGFTYLDSDLSALRKEVKIVFIMTIWLSRQKPSPRYRMLSCVDWCPIAIYVCKKAVLTVVYKIYNDLYRQYLAHSSNFLNYLSIVVYNAGYLVISHVSPPPLMRF
jgi:hypothetical protein